MALLRHLKERLRRAGRPLLLTLIVIAGALPARAGEVPYGQGLLWRVERADAPASHVFGTVHLSDPEVVALPQPVEAVFADAQSLTIELVQSLETSARFRQAMLLRDGARLDALLAPELFARVLRLGARYRMRPWQVRRIAPWALATTFTVPVAVLGREAAREALPLDWTLQERARQHDIPVFGLETVAEQIAVFDRMALASQVALLEQAVAQSGRVEWWWEVLISAYRDRDLGRLYRLTLDQAVAGDPELSRSYTERLIDRRNARMAGRMQPRLEAGNAFVAVGALHLPGEHGVLALLERQGYRISRVY